ncbi:malate synthase [Micromonospora phaseoli]|uniref:Malate synthase n=1 Tax=Micromonospora phaseoli TaxID=1144548 RepID=A0A1H6V4U3_9ACTN|nr:malate synthase A [Micromonospora phaseoli]PZV99139.1 malate synthase [Micromonospora phaseoli]GIJ78659.1 malate synthase [Micromonospora phaseoli]SEI95322.1 malate synthase [Micromonospora phaseoli]
MRHEIIGPMAERFDEVLTPDALAFLVALDSEFAARRVALLDTRRARRDRFATGQLPDFLPETADLRADPSWQVAPPAPGLLDRRAEITGPPDRKMTINALNSGAKVWLADFEDATAPTWHNIISGQLNLIDALDRRIDFTDARGKRYALGDELATIVVRPRGWHLVEKGIVVDGRPISASLVDFGLYFFHCARRQLAAGAGPYFYLPKLEGHREARLWNDIFVFAQHYLHLPQGTIRATTLIETITAAFEMEEILYELREHSAGLNAGRWDYIFSIIKNFGQWPDFVLPDRSEVTMTVPFMRAYTELLVRTCHRRGAHAIGGMAAFVPARDPEVNALALTRVRADKQREAGDGFDGSWVAHPGLVETCREVFDAVLGERPNQIDRRRDDVEVTAGDLLSVDKTPGQVSEAGVRANIAVALCYIDAWLGGAGAVALWNLMEDAATAEIARCQVWQWLHHRTPLAGGGCVTDELVRSMLAEELATLTEGRVDTERERAEQAARIVEETALGEDLPSFFTTGAYARHLGPAREPAMAAR